MGGGGDEGPPGDCSSCSPAAVFGQLLHFIPSMQGHHCLSRNGCSRLRSDTVAQSLGLLPNLRSTDCSKIRRKAGEEKFENSTKARSSVIIRWKDDAIHRFGWDRESV